MVDSASARVIGARTQVQGDAGQTAAPLPTAGSLRMRARFSLPFRPSVLRTVSIYRSVCLSVCLSVCHLELEISNFDNASLLA
jgi:hypothetical protein